MAGAYYIWIMAAFFLGCGSLIALFIGILFVGHWLEKRQTGASHGFMELPESMRSRPAPRSDSLSQGSSSPLPPPPAPPQPQPPDPPPPPPPGPPSP